MIKILGLLPLKIPNGNSLSRGQIDEYTKYVGKLGAKGTRLHQSK